MKQVPFDPGLSTYPALSEVGRKLQMNIAFAACVLKIKQINKWQAERW
jgi:hypothetical protein